MHIETCTVLMAISIAILFFSFLNITHTIIAEEHLQVVARGIIESA